MMMVMMMIMIMMMMIVFTCIIDFRWLKVSIVHSCKENNKHQNNMTDSYSKIIDVDAIS